MYTKLNLSKLSSNFSLMHEYGATHGDEHFYTFGYDLRSILFLIFAIHIFLFSAHLMSLNLFTIIFRKILQ